MRHTLLLLLALLPLSLPSRADVPVNSAPPIVYTACPDAPAFAAVAQTIRPHLWPIGGVWTVQECSEADWARACQQQGVDPASADGMTVWTGRRIYIRQAAKGGPVATFAHELGHVIWPALCHVDSAGGPGWEGQMADWFGKRGSLPFLFSLSGPSAEENFADAFAVNRTARASAEDWGQDYIDGMLDLGWENGQPVMVAGDVLLTGTPFADPSGPNGGAGAGDRGPRNAFDGSAATHYESASASGYVGLHLAAPSVITAVGIQFDHYFEGAAVGSVVEAAGPDGVYHTLATISRPPAGGTVTMLPVTDTTPYSDVRYSDRAGNHVRLVEMQVWGDRETKCLSQF